MSESREPYTTRQLVCDHVMVLSDRERTLIEQWRKEPNAQAVILAKDAARMVSKMVQLRAMARSKQIEPIVVVNVLNYGVGSVLAFEL